MSIFFSRKYYSAAWSLVELRMQNHKQMEIYTTFLDRKKQYCQNDYTTQGNLQIQHNPYQITNDIFTELEQKFFNLNVNMKNPE